jgi:Fe-S-cluster containining protein
MSGISQWQICNFNDASGLWFCGCSVALGVVLCCSVALLCCSVLFCGSSVFVFFCGPIVLCFSVALLCSSVAMGSAAFCLDLHAGYRCRHSGACCTAGWHIPIEHTAFRAAAAHFAHEAARLFVRAPDLPGDAAAIIGTTSTGACVFFEKDRGRLCRIHRELGHDLLPSACRIFPRIILKDSRGTLVTLSHFCPTAAALLFSRAAARIVEAPRSLLPSGPLEGLDATDTLPPLLRPGMLMDIEGYEAWERHGVRVLADVRFTADVALQIIGEATASVEGWAPGRGSLREAVERSFDCPLEARGETGPARHVERMMLAIRSVPSGLDAPVPSDNIAGRWETVASICERYDRVIRNYLAARLFGNWIAYHAQRLSTVVEWLKICLSILKVETARHTGDADLSDSSEVVRRAIRATDLLVVHLSDTRVLARLIDLRE